MKPLYIVYDTLFHVPDSKVHGAYMGPTRGRKDLGGPHVGPIILAIWGALCREAMAQLTIFDWKFSCKVYCNQLKCHGIVILYKRASYSIIK